MKYLIILSWLLLILLPAAIATMCAPSRTANAETVLLESPQTIASSPQAISAVEENHPTTAQTENTGNPWLEPARQVLLGSSCAACHRSSLPTGKAGALAIFDLDKDPWNAGMKEENYGGMLGRVTGSAKFSEEEKSTLRKFVEGALAGS